MDATHTERLLPDEPLEQLQDWLDLGGGGGIIEAAERSPEQIVDEISASGLRGRGGAGFPTGRKWSSVRDAAEGAGSMPYLVANAAEGEPGTYKDRALLARNPYAFLEGLLIARYATGAQRAYVGIKEHFPERERLESALTEILDAGWPGSEVVEIVAGPDDYLFGEESAMLEVIEGNMPMPRIPPPYEVGLFASTTDPHPTVVNNVETLSHVAHIVREGPEWFRQVGTESSPGTMVFTVVGDVESPGVYELPLGTPLGTLLEDIAGATNTKAVYSGTSNAVITPAMFDTPLGFDEMREAGSGMGSGGFVVYGESHCIVRVLATLSYFLAVESCGQCNACKLGTGAITDLLQRIDRGEGDGTDLEAILKRNATVTDQNRCYLPVGEQLMVDSTVRAFEDEFLAHLGEPCPSDLDVPVPKIVNIDEDTGEVTYAGPADPAGHRRQEA